jgi:hypothetical protein
MHVPDGQIIVEMRWQMNQHPREVLSGGPAKGAWKADLRTLAELSHYFREEVIEKVRVENESA